ncbi:MAG TPA: type II secretion system F family protein [Rhodocyclaceae bacterium]|nr:type II secretion system F family protein [Rhodocyclaceae bacterium]
MPIYAYKAINPAGRRVQGRMDAVNEVDLEMRLKRMELDFINGQPITHRTLFAGNVPRRELINFCFHLEQLLRAGVPILDGLADLRDSIEHPRFREVLAGTIESIEGGKTLSDAMGDYPQAFDDVFRNLVHAGEETGNLAEVLHKLFEDLKWQDELAAHTKKLIMYPSFMLAVIVPVIFFMMIYLVPKLTTFIRNMGQEIPTQTRILMAVSEIFTHYWPLIAGLPIIAAFALFVAVRTKPAVRYRFHSVLLRLPIGGEILRKIVLSRFASTFAMMYASGISVIETLRITEDVVGNAVVREAIHHAGQRIEEGQNITLAFQSVGMFPPLVIRMLRVGENSGALDTALENVSYFYNRDVRESIERMQTLIEPALTVIIGLLLGWVILSVLGPIYDLITKLKT